ncbi:hypothetical protein [Catellatospora sichuanensis]|uniref:hypothetical protein n=1 Tax=Catellatospora sichuanensis TaxID=1969805 RepID=UPI0011825245|nr:hypothetical protein [Catellatospora sichuanensis]
MTEWTARSAAGARALLRVAAAFAAGAVAISAYVVATVDLALDRYVERHHNINVEDWRFGPLLDVVVNLTVVTAGALAVAVPALRLAQRGGRPGIGTVAVLGTGVILIGLPLLPWSMFDPVLAYEAHVHAAQAGAYGWWYYPALAGTAVVAAACVLCAVVLGRSDRQAGGAPVPLPRLSRRRRPRG